MEATFTTLSTMEMANALYHLAGGMADNRAAAAENIIALEYALFELKTAAENKRTRDSFRALWTVLQNIAENNNSLIDYSLPY